VSDALEPKRQQLRLRRSRSSQREIRRPAVTVPGAEPVEALHYRTRQTLGAATVLASVVALTHQPVAGALAVSRGAGVLSAAYAVLMWPAPLTQPVLAGVGAFVLSLIGVQSRGWRQVTRRQCWYLLAATEAAVLGAGPMVFVLALAVIALAVASGVMIFLALLVLLLARRR
jgi:hypothetical protein